MGPRNRVFYEDLASQPADAAKNPVSLVGGSPETGFFTKILHRSGEIRKKTRFLCRSASKTGRLETASTQTKLDESGLKNP